MTPAFLLSDIASELALFAAVGFLLFAADDLVVDLLYFARRLWRSTVVYSRYPRAFAGTLPAPARPGRIAVFVPAWDESAVIADMLRSTIGRWGGADYRLFVGFYANDPLTEAAIARVSDPRIEAVRIDHDGPTTKADCLNHLYDALLAAECRERWTAKAVVLHDAEDLVHPLEIALFDSMIEKAAVVQLPVIPLVDPDSRWISGHYCDEFAESHGKDLVVREAVGAAIPLAGVGCAVSRDAIARLAADNHGRPFAAQCMTEDYELGLRVGAFADKTMFVRMPAAPGSKVVVSSRGHFPATLDAAVRQKARWIGGIALAGWERLGWRGGLGERWMRMRDRRGPLAALLMVAGYVAILLWSQLWVAGILGAPVPLAVSPALAFLLKVNAALLVWRIVVRAGFVTATYGIRQGLWSVPRLLVGNLIAILAVRRAIAVHAAGGPRRWDKTHHMFPVEEPAR